MAKISKINLRQLFAKGLKPAQEAFYNLFDSYWHKDELIDISSVKSLQTELSNKLDVGAQDTLVEAFNNAIDEITIVAQSSYKGVAEANTIPPTTGVYWYRVADNNATTFVNFKDSNNNSIITTSTDFKDSAGNYYDVTIEVKDNISLLQKKIRPGANSTAEQVTFTPVIKFTKKKDYSIVNQSGNIDFTLDASGTVKDAIKKVLVISDGSGDINFSTDFDVQGDEIDKTKNQVIYFIKENIIEYKTVALIQNVIKSGQTTPVDLDPDAEAYINRINAASGVITTPVMYSINSFFLSAKSNGYFAKLKGIWLAIGSNTPSRLVNGITGAPSATLESGTITNDGIVGVLNSNMNPSDIFTLDSFSYGIHNTTAIYSNSASMGCGVSSTSGILLICTATNPSGQFLFSGPNKDIYANAANADSLGTYVVTRTGASLAKLFKNQSLLFTHTVAQGSGTLPNIPFAIGGYNNAGSFADDGRTSKWAFLALGLTDAESVSIVTDLNNLMTAIGR
ncbi:hypothetical protein [Chryseobacterium cucumeris]|uniref:hypothetical protein n=1 Tax=Chryseobacterium cucumeris TaxID=1813611 RepID=UPI0037C10550